MEENQNLDETRECQSKPPRRRSRWVLPLVILSILLLVCLTLFAAGVLVVMRTDTFKGLMGQAQVAAKCQVQLQTISAALHRHEISRGEYPQSLDMLYPDYLPSRSAFRCPADPRDPNSGPPSYSYTKPAKEASETSVVCVCDRHRIVKDQPPVRIMLLKNGEVSMTPAAGPVRDSRHK
ncbi:MAG: hypothetical protein Q7T82_09210 [Armatimonadota bacterium]|nr:hypothetical protein [Armatimonadota bacterium]